MKRHFDDTVKVSERRDAATHGVRLRQQEYDSRSRKRVVVAETYCGRHKMKPGKPAKGAVDCITCIQAIVAEAK